MSSTQVPVLPGSGSQLSFRWRVFRALRDYVLRKADKGKLSPKGVASFEVWRPFNHPSTWDTDAVKLLRPLTAVEQHSLANTFVVVTGANAGIGREAAKGYALRGATVVLGCRNRQRAEAAVASIVQEANCKGVRDEEELRSRLIILSLELSSMHSVAAFADSVKALPAAQNGLDTLHLSAGAQGSIHAGTDDGSELEYTFAGNYLGHFYLTNLLGPLLSKAAKVGRDVRVNLLTSGGHTKAPALPAGGWEEMVRYNASQTAAEEAHARTFKQRLIRTLVPPDAPPAFPFSFKRYALTKLAGILMVRELARRLRPSAGISVTAVSPGATFAPALAAISKMRFWILRVIWTFLIRILMFTSREAGASALYPTLGVPAEGKMERLHDAYYNPAGRRKVWGEGTAAGAVLDPAAWKSLWEFSVAQIQRVHPEFQDYYEEADAATD